jgi:hypothetical protein
MSINATTAATTAVIKAVATSGVGTVTSKADIEAAIAVAVTATATGRNASSAKNPIAGQPAIITKNG